VFVCFIALLLFLRAGDAIESFDGYKFLNAPPISILLDQQLLEMSMEHSTSDVTRNKKVTYIEQSLLGIGCTVDKSTPLTLFPFHITIKLDSITSTPQRKDCTALSFTLPNRADTTTGSHGQSGNSLNGSEKTNGTYSTSRPSKRQRFDEDRNESSHKRNSEMVDVMAEVTYFAEIIATTLETAMQDVDREVIVL
jgi:hypothetical protein